MADTTSQHNLAAKATLQDDLSAGLQKIRQEFQNVQGSTAPAGAAMSELGKVADGLKSKFADFGAEVKNAGQAITSGLLGPFAAASVGALALGAAITSAIKAQSEDEASQARLKTALQDNVANWQQYTGAINAQIERGKQLGVTDEATRTSLGLLVSGTKDVTQAINLESLAMDLAAARGLSLEQATTLLMRVQSGHIAILSRYGIEVQKGETVTQALADVQQRYGGQAAAYANTLGGSMDKAKIAFEDAAKSAIVQFEPAIIAALNAVTAIIPKVADAGEKLMTVLKPALDIIGFVFQTVGTMADLAGRAFGLWSDNSSSAAQTADQNVAGSVNSMSANLSTFADNAQTAGTDAGSGFTGNLSGGISDGQPQIDTAVGDVGTSLDIADSAGTTGDAVGTRYVQGSPGGIVPAINAGLPSVAAANKAVGDTLNKPEAFATIGQNNANAYIAAASAAIKGSPFGQLPGNTFGQQSTQTFGAPIAAGVNTASLFTPAPAAPTLETAGPPAPNQMPLGHKDTAWPSAEDIAAQKAANEALVQQGVLTQAAADFDNKLLDQEAKLTEQRSKNIDFNRKETDELNKMNEAKAKAAEAANKHAGALANEAAKKAEMAQDATSSLQRQEAERKATDDVTAAQAHLKDVQQQWKDVLDADAAALKDVQDAEKSATGAIEDQIKATQAQAQALARSFDDSSHAIDVALRGPTAALKALQQAAQEANDAFDAQAHALADAMYNLEDQEKAAMAPFNAAVEAAQKNLSDFQDAAAQAIVPFDNALQSANDNLQKQQDILQGIADKYQDKLFPLQQQLAALQQQQAQANQAEQLHKEQVNIDNLAASLATATGAQRQQLQAQLDAARAQQGRDQQTFAVQDQIAALQALQKEETNAQQAAVKAAEEQVKAAQKARDEEAKSLAERQKQLEAQLKMAQQAQAAQQKMWDERKSQIEEEQRLLEHQRAEFDYEEKQKEEAVQKQIDALNAQKQAEQQQYDDQKRLLDMRIADEQASLAQTQAYYQTQVDDINARTDADKASADQATASAQAVVTAAQARQKALQDAYTIIDQTNQATDKGAKLTDAQAQAYRDAKKTVDDIVPSLGNLSAGYSTVGTQVVTATTTVQTGIAETFGEKPTDETKNVPKVWNAGLDRMYQHLSGAWKPQTESTFNAFFSDVGSALQAALDSWVKAWQSAMSQMTPPSWTNGNNNNGTTPGFAKGGIVTQPTFAMLGEDEPEIVIPFSKLGSFAGSAYAGVGRGGFGGAQPVHVFNLNGDVAIYAQKLPTDTAEWDRVMPSLSQSLQKHMVRRGKGING